MNKDETINENHKRSIGIALVELDKVLCAIESWTGGRESRGVIYIEANDLTQEKKELLRRLVSNARKLLAGICDELDLIPVTVSASHDIWIKCWGTRDMLAELDSRHMKRYGELPPSSVEYLNSISRSLEATVDIILKAVRRVGQDERPVN